MTQPVKIAVLLGHGMSNFRILTAGVPVDYVVADFDDATPGDIGVEAVNGCPAFVTRGAAEYLGDIVPFVNGEGNSFPDVPHRVAPAAPTDQPPGPVCADCSEGYALDRIGDALRCPGCKTETDAPADPNECGQCDGSGTLAAENADQGQPRTFIVDIWRDSDIWTWEGVARSSDEARAAALEGVCEDWGLSYPDWEDMAGDMDGTATRDLGAVMAERIPYATLQLYRRLADGLSDMVECGRLTVGDVPDDYAWLVEQLASIAAADPGEATVPGYMRNLE